MKQLLVIVTALYGVYLAAEVEAAILCPMDEEQTDHLKAYGVVCDLLQDGKRVEWLVGYRGGSFLVSEFTDVLRPTEQQAVVMIDLDKNSLAVILTEVAASETMAVVPLTRSPRVAVYAPPTTLPIGDLLRPLLEYSGVTYTAIWDEEVLVAGLDEFDVLMMEHEDFTGQYGKFYATFRSADWYREQVSRYETEARRLGFRKDSEAKKAVVEAIRDWVVRGGFLFAMCSATDTFDIALATRGIDICAPEFDGDPPDPDYNRKLDYTRTMAFKDFTLKQNPYEYEFSDIDMPGVAYRRGPNNDFFTLFEFSAKQDPVPTMLTQCHTNVVKGFMGQTTGFNRKMLKDGVLTLGEPEGSPDTRYIHGNFGNGTFTWLGGHDPEDWQHRVGDPPTDLSLHKNSPGYRLILNNVLFPAAEKKKQKT